jgi:hypothetical protein
MTDDPLVDVEGQIRDLAQVVSDIDGPALGDESLARLRSLNSNDLPLVPEGTRLGPCIAKVGNFIAVG